MKLVEHARGNESAQGLQLAMLLHLLTQRITADYTLKLICHYLEVFDSQEMSTEFEDISFLSAVRDAGIPSFVGARGGERGIDMAQRLAELLDIILREAGSGCVAEMVRYHFVSLRSTEYTPESANIIDMLMRVVSLEEKNVTSFADLMRKRGMRGGLGLCESLDGLINEYGKERTSKGWLRCVELFQDPELRELFREDLDAFKQEHGCGRAWIDKEFRKLRVLGELGGLLEGTEL